MTSSVLLENTNTSPAATTRRMSGPYLSPLDSAAAICPVVKFPGAGSSSSILNGKNKKRGKDDLLSDTDDKNDQEILRSAKRGKKSVCNWTGSYADLLALHLPVNIRASLLI